jgi:hypothetical protein
MVKYLVDRQITKHPSYQENKELQRLDFSAIHYLSSTYIGDAKYLLLQLLQKQKEKILIE